jgi:hypothetical protein
VVVTCRLPREQRIEMTHIVRSTRPPGDPWKMHPVKPPLLEASSTRLSGPTDG